MSACITPTCDRDAEPGFSHCWPCRSHGSMVSVPADDQGELEQLREKKFKTPAELAKLAGDPPKCDRSDCQNRVGPLKNQLPHVGAFWKRWCSRECKNFCMGRRPGRPPKSLNVMAPRKEEPVTEVKEEDAPKCKRPACDQPTRRRKNGVGWLRHCSHRCLDKHGKELARAARPAPNPPRRSPPRAQPPAAKPAPVEAQGKASPVQLEEDLAEAVQLLIDCRNRMRLIPAAKGVSITITVDRAGRVSLTPPAWN